MLLLSRTPRTPLLVAGLAALAVGFTAAPAQNAPPQANAVPAAPAGLTEYQFGQPTGDAVEMLELINRARANPAAEGQRLVAALTALYPNGYPGGPSYAQLAAQFAAFPTRPPLVFNVHLDAAATAHLADNIRLGTQSHDSPDGTSDSVRVAGFGYSPLYAENCNGEPHDTASTRPWMIHADYELNDAGHRKAILEDGDILGEVEVGIAYQAAGGWNVEDFGGDSTVTLLGGAVFTDTANTGFYASGEGLGGVRVTSDASTYYALTVNGAYSLPLDLVPLYDASKPNPAVNVTFTAPDGGVATRTVTLGHTVSSNGDTYSNANSRTRYDNAKADWVRAAAPTPTPTPTPNPREPDVTIAAAPGGGFIVMRTGDTGKALVVSYKAKGTAVAGRDYLPLPGTRKIKAGKGQALIRVTLLPGATGTLKLVVVATADYNAAVPSQAKLKLSGLQ